MRKDKITKTYEEPPYDPDKDPEEAGIAESSVPIRTNGSLGQPTSNGAGTGHQSSVNSKKTRRKKIFKLSMWIGIPLSCMVIISFGFCMFGLVLG